MSGEFEAAGAAATAGLVAGAIEGREARDVGEGPCLNCGAQLTGRYCANCGQAAHAHRTLAHVFEEALFGLLSFDTKIWRTVPMVIGRPGTLTRNYVYGKRARYISPLALFLFCVFLMFFAFSFVHLPGSGLTMDRVSAGRDLAEARTDLADAERDLVQARAHPDPDQPAGLETRLAQQAVTLAQAEVRRREEALAQIEAARAHSATAAGHIPQHSQTWQEEVQNSARAGNLHVDLGIPALNQEVVRAAQNPDLAMYKFQNAASKYSFLLAPISLPFIWLLFAWKRGLTLYDHVSFAFYALSFVSLLFIAAVLLSETPWTRWAVPWLVGLGVPIHTYFHLKGAYALGWFSALWRTLFMLFFASIALTIFLVTIFILGLVE